MIPLAMAMMAVSSINVCLPTIETGLGATDSQLQWLLSGYALTFGITLVPFGRLGDVLGRSSLWIFGLTIFTLASAACGFAQDSKFLVIARICQGIGSGLFNPQTTGMIQQYFSGIGRARAYGIFGMVISASVALGPASSGILIKMVGSHDGWRAAFLWNVPLGLLGILMACFWFPFEKERTHLRQRRELKQAAALADGEKASRPKLGLDLDPVGMVMLAIGVLCMMFPFMSHPDPRIWLLLIGGPVFFTLWVVWENSYKKRGKSPIVDLNLFKHLSFSFGTATSATMFLGSTSIFAVMALFLQSGNGIPAFEAGFIGVPNAIASACGSYLSGKRALAIGRKIIPFSLSLILIGPIGAIALSYAFLHWGWSFWFIAIPLGIQGFGQGSMGACNQTLAMLDIPSEDGGTAGGIKTTAERIATAVGTAVITAVFFGFSATSWGVGLTAAYLCAAALILVAVFVALADLKINGPGARTNQMAN